MKRPCLSILFLLCSLFTLSVTESIDIAYAAEADSSTQSHESAQPSDPHNLTGEITEIIIAGGITYVEVDTGTEKVWAAGTADSSLEKGDTISFSSALPMENFHSKSLDRDFAVIYFVKQFITGKPASGAGKQPGQSARPQAPPSASSSAARTPGEVVAGGLLRDVSLDGLNTENKRLSDYKGKPLLINVWASWCGPCRIEMGSLERLAERYNGKMFNVIGISTDDYRNKAKGFIRLTEVSFENYIDHSLVLENMLGASTIPLTILVDADGRVLEKVRGSREWDSPEIVEAIGYVFQIELM